MVVGQAIIEYNSIAAIAHKLQVPQETELMAHGRLCQTQHGGQIADTHLPFFKSPEDFDPGLIRQSLKGLGQGLYLIRRKSRSHSLLHNWSVNKAAIT
jgi:hypothetical protein